MVRVVSHGTSQTQGPARGPGYVALGAVHGSGHQGHLVQGGNLAQGALVQGAVEVPSGHDEQLARFFQQMRQASGLTPVMIAARLGIDPSVLQTFERGAILALPAWQETVRIVTAYARMVGVDPNIALQRIQAQRTAGPAVRHHAHETPGAAPFEGQRVPAAAVPRPNATQGGRYLAAPHAPNAPTGPVRHHTGTSSGRDVAVPLHLRQANQPMAPASSSVAIATFNGVNGNSANGTGANGARAPDLSPINPLQPPPRPARPETEAAQRRIAAQTEPPGGDQPAAVPRRRRHPARVAVKYVTIPMMVVAGLWYTVQNPTSVHAALGQLPEPLPRIARAGMDLVLISTSPTKDGLRMINTGDPRSRKADRLPGRQPGN